MVMGLWDRLTAEFVDVIEWLDSSNDTLVYRFERYGNAIKYGAMLTVREGQMAVFVNEGEIADVFTPGLYQLETGNLPLLTTLQSWKHGFNSPFKAEVYFFNTRRFTDLKWGTRNPIMLRDREFGPVRLRAFGTYELRIADPVHFLREIVGTDGDVRTAEITGQLRNLIVTRFTSALASSNIPALDLAANYDQLSDFITDKIAPDFEDYGIALERLLVENISLPPAVEEALDRRTQMGVVGDLDRYAKFQAAEAMRIGAANEGSGGAGVGMGIGMAMANQFASAMNAPQPGVVTTPVPPLPPQVSYHVALNGQSQGPFDISALQGLVRSGQLTGSSLVWTQGMSGWTAASAVPALSGLFAGAMPPPPPLPHQ